MRQQIVLIACLCSAAIIYGSPVPENNNELDVLQIPLSNGKELDVLSLENSNSALSDRNKRTIGLLRELFPDLTKQIDDQANIIISQVIRALGPSVLRTAIQGNAGGSGRTATSARDDFDADFDDDDDSDTKSDDDNGARVQIELPTFSPEDEDDDSDNETDSDAKASSSTSTASSKQNGKEIDLTMLNKQLEETIRVARQVSAAENSENSLNEVSSKSDDQEATESKAPALDELSLDSNEDIDGDDRNKRFLAFGGTKTVNAAPGSGNFLFDIVRLFSGSVQPQSVDVTSTSEDGAVVTDDDATRSTDGYTEGIPGPVTRLAVLANRGFANLIQDLILRIAATSERLVNFKAKLITALI